MKYWVKELEKINKELEPASKLKNPSSLEFAVEHAARTKDWRLQLAYLLRAIVVDHPFLDGNKRTGAYLIFKFFEKYKVPVDAQKVDILIIKIAKNSVTDIQKIRRLIHDETL